MTATVTIEKNCVRCGTLVALEAPTPVPVYARHLPVVCDPCDEKMEQEQAEEREREKIAEARDRVRRSGMPSIFMGLRWEDMDTDEPQRDEVIQAARAWSEHGEGGLYLYGPVGTGKTRLASIAAKSVIRGGRDVSWTSVPVLIARWSAEFGSKDKREAGEMLTRGRRALVLDDIDKVKASDSVLAQLFAAIDGRVVENTPLIVTANLSPGRLSERFGGSFGEAIASRLMEHCTVLNLAGRDRRLDANRSAVAA